MMMTNVAQKNEPMHELIKESIAKNLVDYRKLKGISINRLAAQIDGCSAATLSKIENGIWEDVSDEMFRRLLAKVRSSVDTIVTTSDFIACQNTCEHVRKHRLMYGVVGDTGMGKTTAMEAVAMKKNTFYIRYSKTQKPKQFFVALLLEIGVRYESTIDDVVSRIVKELSALDNPLLIIDEAGKIPHTLMLYLHDLRDKTNRSCGIVLAGMPYFKNNLIKFAGKQKEGCAEFFRRINNWVELKGLSRKEVLDICELNEITDEEAIRRFKNIKLYGDLQNAIQEYKLEKNTL